MIDIVRSSLKKIIPLITYSLSADAMNYGTTSWPKFRKSTKLFKVGKLKYDS